MIVELIQPFLLRKEYKMSYVVIDKDRDMGLLFDRYARDMDIVTVAEPVMNIAVATVFEDKDEGEYMIKEVIASKGYPSENLEVISLADRKKAEDDIRKKEAEEFVSKMYFNSSTDAKRDILTQEYIKGGEAAVNAFKTRMGDTSDLMHYSDDERAAQVKDKIEKEFKISLTSEQVEDIKQKYLQQPKV